MPFDPSFSPSAGLAPDSSSDSSPCGGCHRVDRRQFLASASVLSLGVLVSGCGDGIISALQVLQAVIRSGKSLADQLEGVRLFPQSLINVQLREGFEWRTHEGFQETLRSVESELGSSGRVLVRPSGTEPVLRVMVETHDPSTAKRLAQSLADAAGQAAR